MADIELIDPSNIVADYSDIDYAMILRGDVPVRTLVGLLTHKFNVKRFGAVGDGRTQKDAVFTASSDIITSATGFPTNVVGMKILANEQLLTVTQRNSPTSITVSSAITLSGTGKTIRYGTDNTAAFQACANACYQAGGGTCWIPLDPRPYFIAGPLVTNDNKGLNPNSQIFTPVALMPYQGGTEQPYVITWKAEVRPNQVAASFLDVGDGDYNQGTMVQSILPLSMVSGVRPAVFGMAGYSDAFGTFALVENNFEEMWVRTHMHPSQGSYMTACEFTDSTNVTYRECRADIDCSLNTCVAPTAVNFGLMGPRSNGGTKNFYENNLVVGYHEGYSIGEHGTMIGGQAMGCIHPIDFQRAGHMSRVYGFTVHWCQQGIGFDAWNNGYDSSSHVVELSAITIERSSLGKWFDTFKDVDDPTNGLKGNMSYAISGAAGIAKNGGALLTCRYAGDPA